MTGALRGAFAGAAAVTLIAAAGPPHPLVASSSTGSGFAHGVVDVSSTPALAEGEEFVATNPLDPHDILIGSNQWQPPTSQGTGAESVGASGFTTCALFDSHDGGHTWHGRRLGVAGLGPMPPPAPAPTLPVVGQPNWEFQDPGSIFGADQYPAFDRHGNAYYQCLYFGYQTHGLEQIWFFHSGDAGRTWSPPQVVQDELSSNTHADRGYIAVDNSGGPRDGTVYLTWESIVFQPLLPHVFMRVGTPTAVGLHWSDIIQLDDAAHPAMWSARQVTQVAPDGTLDISYNSTGLVTPAEFDPQLTPIQLVLAASHDGGRTFSYNVIDPDVRRVSSPDEAFYYFTEMVGAFAVSPADPRRMAEAWPDLGPSAAPSAACGPPSPLCTSRIMLRVSVDGGRTWSPRIDVADDPADRTNQHDHASLGYLPDGRLLIAWRDRRSGGGQWTDPFEVFLRVGAPTATGYAFGPSLRLTERPQPPTTDHHGTMPTEYMSVIGDASGVQASWDQLDSAANYPGNVYRHLDLADLAPGMPSGVASETAGGATATPNTASDGRSGTAAAISAMIAAGLVVLAGRRRRHRHGARRNAQRDA